MVIAGIPFIARQSCSPGPCSRAIPTSSIWSLAVCKYERGEGLGDLVTCYDTWCHCTWPYLPGHTPLYLHTTSDQYWRWEQPWNKANVLLHVYISSPVFWIPPCSLSFQCALCGLKIPSGLFRTTWSSLTSKYWGR